MKSFFEGFKEYSGFLKLSLVILTYVAIRVIFGIPCPIKYLTGISCPGCGMTRGLLSLLSFEFENVLYFHPLAFSLVPTILILAFLKIKKKEKAFKIAVGVSCGMLIGVYLYRFIVCESPALEFSPCEGAIYRALNKIVSFFS